MNLDLSAGEAFGTGLDDRGGVEVSVGGVIFVGGIPLGGAPGALSPSVNGGGGESDGGGLFDESPGPISRLGVAPVRGFWAWLGFLAEFDELPDELGVWLPVDPLADPGLKLSGCVGSESSGGVAALRGGLDALAIKDGSTPSANGFENGPRCRTGGVWLGETADELVAGRAWASCSGGRPGEGKT